MRFDVLKNGKVITSVELTDGSHRIGRGDDCIVRLEGNRVSKAHAMLVIRRGKAAIVDTGSSNGTFINGVLIQKQRVYLGDEVVIADYKLRIAPEPPAATPPPRSTLKVASSGAEPTIPPEPADLSDKIRDALDKKVLKPFYQALGTFDWRLVLASLLLGALILSVLLGVIPVVRWANQNAQRLSLDRAHTILGQVARDNYRILSKTQDSTRLTVDAAEGEPGFLSIYVLDPKSNTVLAPAKYFNKSVNDVYSLLALQRVAESDPSKPASERVSVLQGDDTYIVAQPIRIYAPEENKPDDDIDKAPEDERRNKAPLTAVVLGSFQIRAGASATYEPLLEAALFALFLSLVAFFLITKMVTYPLVVLQEQLDAALKGDDGEIQSLIRMPELEALATTINFSVSRIRSGGSGPADPSMGNLGVTGDDPILQVLQELDGALTDGVLLLDRDKKVTFVGKILEDLIGLRMEYARGQNISDASRDQAFAGTAIDIAERVLSSLGQSQTSTLDINGVSREIVAVGHRAASGDINYVVIIIKLGAG